uniref:carbapenem self-resistance protein CarG family protein n=1 Tax=Candidatus Halocynthiibacter alkanivorans TaxID=2267619 RepID=UPI00135B246F
FSFNANAFNLIELNQGVNNVDLNDDGLIDYALLAQYDNNKSHLSQTITFYVHKPEGGYSIMPSIVDDEFPYFSLSLSGSTVTVSGFSLVRYKDKIYFSTADKSIINAYDDQFFDYVLYEFISSDEHPGTPLFHWQKVFSATSINKYNSANQAFTELGSLLANFEPG